MGILSSTIFISIDGVHQAPGGPDEDPEGDFERGGWSAPMADADIGDWIAEATTLRPDTLLLGRKTYDIFARYWPTAEVSPISRKLNEMPKFVASRSLSSVDWTNTTLLDGDVADAVTRLKDEHDVIGTIGSGDLVKTLLRQGLVDELRLLVHPVIIGSGKHFFGVDGAGAPGTWHLASTLTFASGTMANTYRPAGALETGDMT
jgi:dihydrofolate reductase